MPIRRRVNYLRQVTISVVNNEEFAVRISLTLKEIDSACDQFWAIGCHHETGDKITLHGEPQKTRMLLPLG
jgi:hypothetical protein